MVEMPPAPDETGHPVSTFHKRQTVWKKVPISQDDTDTRIWVEFDRTSGYPIAELDLHDADDTDDQDSVCSRCGEVHAEDMDIG